MRLSDHPKKPKWFVWMINLLEDYFLLLLILPNQSISSSVKYKLGYLNPLDWHICIKWKFTEILVFSFKNNRKLIAFEETLVQVGR